LSLLHDGYTVLDGFLHADEVGALRPHVEERIAAPLNPSMNRTPIF
jgi:hypothetical protein